MPTQSKLPSHGQRRYNMTACSTPSHEELLRTSFHKLGNVFQPDRSLTVAARKGAQTEPRP
jgi:hypothetical protein